MNSHIFDKLSFLSLFLVIVLLPIFFLPFTDIPIETTKGLLLVLGLVLTAIFWAIARFMDGKIVLPKSYLALSGLGVVLVFFLSAFFSSSKQVSLFGVMFDVGSFWFIFAAVTLMLATAVVFRNHNRARLTLLGAIFSSIIVIIFQSLHLFFPNALSLGVLANKTANVVGSWNALGLFTGFAVLMFLLVLEFFPVSRIARIVLRVMIVLSILLATVINFPLVWALIGISGLLIFVYRTSVIFPKLGEEENAKKDKSFPITSFIIVIVSLIFFLAGQSFGNVIPERLNVSNLEVGPSLFATMSVTKQVIIKDPILGTGPNRFSEAWAMHKPANINNSQFWNVVFESGSGLLPTLTATTGILGILAWLVFLGLFLVNGSKMVFINLKNGVNWEMMAFFVLSLYLFIASFFYSAGAVIFLLAFAFTGIFIGLSSANQKEEIVISFLSDHRKSFFSILSLILLIILSVGLAFKYVEKFTSVAYFEKALTADNIPLAESSIGKAISLHNNDLYLRTYAQIYLIKLNSLVNKGNLSKSEQADLQASFDQAIRGAQLATQYNSNNYINLQLLGSIYQSAGALGVEEAYANAALIYQSAANLNPLNPGLKLAIANSYFADNKLANAKDYASQAIALKPNYSEALITLAEISKRQGDTKVARSYAEAALRLDPNNEDLIKYIDALNLSSSPTSTEESEN